MIRLAPLAFLTLLLCAGCEDPQHGAFHSKTLGWLVSLIVAAVFLALGMRASMAFFAQRRHYRRHP